MYLTMLLTRLFPVKPAEVGQPIPVIRSIEDWHSSTLIRGRGREGLLRRIGLTRGNRGGPWLIG